MTAGQVLLVDDVPGERANFEQAFGGRLTVAPSIDILNDHLRHGLTWDIAFVDFNLSSPTSTGLTALLRLHHERPGTKIVTYSQFTESGRTLYAAAARHWFDAAALMDKTKNDPATLVRYRESHLRRHQPDPGHVAAAAAVGAPDRQPAGRCRPGCGSGGRCGTRPGTCRRSPRCCTSRRAACAASRTARPRRRSCSTRSSTTSRRRPRTRNKKGILAAFAAEHRHFLTAPDLSTVMSPGTRRRALTWPA